MAPLHRTTPSDPWFVSLTTALDADLRARYGEAQDAYDAHNEMDPTARVVVAVAGAVPVGCGAFRHHAEGLVEIKRMFVVPGARGQGTAREILAELEKWAAADGYTGAVLETGRFQPESLTLYARAGYTRVENYGPYIDMPMSVCLSKSFERA
ncbi:GNAT family N-acetyltransferase [Rhodococcus triatomae]|uniref:Acetyltransferase (GNAT) family protein n=1 Tax=Rhodococcus triatomae TaxID=300028 RepID=A0A1G8DTH9_9NOCA|nr:GNAT family N-acetyltransferase [Rhodococcus triatomae]QNG18347.1 GNAT family N-acetyltransferase [Rhodococcus triatomae]QNG21982.1 GNAT family N-acetyltransferase [Rhodococcus triatomae]SDH61016.1 Acetyltransferase (GNAT) family protein [Rhodococcus triatomae]